MQLKDCKEGQVVLMTATIVKQGEGQTMLVISGIGGSGQWSVANSADCLVVGKVA